MIVGKRSRLIYRSYECMDGGFGLSRLIYRGEKKIRPSSSGFSFGSAFKLMGLLLVPLVSIFVTASVSLKYFILDIHSLKKLVRYIHF